MMLDAFKISWDMNKNRMERFIGEVRDREKVMRYLKIKINRSFNRAFCQPET